MSLLDKLIEKTEEEKITIELQIRLKISDYEEKAGSLSMAKNYAQRDNRGAKEKAIYVITRKMNVSRLPYTIDVVPTFQYFKDNKAWWSVEISGGDQKFLKKLQKMNLRLLSNKYKPSTQKA